MRRLLYLAAALSACASPPAASPPAALHGEVIITLGADAVATARAVTPAEEGRLQVLEIVDDVAILSADAADLDALSHAMHEHHDRCGGYMVHESLAEARAALHEPPAHVARPGLDYTLDRASEVNAVLPALAQERILGTIRELSSMQNRYYQSATGAAASTWLRDRWQSFTTRPDVTIELFDHGYAQKSVILTIPGTTRADEVVVIGGHLDSIALGGSASTAPGADDDASGIATLTEVLRVLLASDYRPERTLKFMAYAAEEVGLRGSLAIVKDFKRREVEVVGALQLDMTNYQGSDRDIWLISDYTSAAQNAFLARLIDTYVGATYGYDTCGYACSDHASWHRAGVPASMPFESRSRDRNQKIHTRNDTLETSGNNAAHALTFARLAAAYAIELGKGELGTGAAPAIMAVPAVPASEANRFAVLALAFALGIALASGVRNLARVLPRLR